MSHPAGKVKIEVYADSEARLADEEQDFTGRPAGAPLIVTWTPSSDAAVARIEVHAYDAQGNWVGVEIAPWFVPIPHEDVNFRTGSSDIDEPETPKLEAAFAKLQDVLAKDAAHGRMHPGITLYIAGPHRHRRDRGAQPEAVAGSRALDRQLVPQARRQAPHLVRGVRRDVARGEDRRQRRRAAQPPRRLRPLRRPADLLGRLQAELEADPLVVSKERALRIVAA